MNELPELPAVDESKKFKINMKQIVWIALPLTVFSFATYLAIRGTFAYEIKLSNTYWLSAGWIFAALAVIATMLWAAAVGEQESKDNRAIRKELRRAATTQATLAEQIAVAARSAQAAVEELEKSTNLEALSNAKTELSRRLAEAQLAADQAVKYSDKAMAVPTLFTRNAIPATLIATINLFIVCGMVIVSFYTAATAHGWAAAIIWCCAFLVMGGAAGFLFGIPRSRNDHNANPSQSSSSALPRQQAAGEASRHSSASGSVQYQQSPIEQMADWLTKTIVGVALVNLREIPGHLRNLAALVAASLGDPGTLPANAQSTSFSLALILYFALVGFLCGYLLTQMFLMDYVNRRSA